MNRILLLLLLTMALGSASASASGRTVGNGGDVITCDGVAGHKPVELLDFYEGRSLRGIQADLGAQTLSVPEKIELALTRLDRVSPARARRYREHVASFFNETLFLKDAHLVDIPDSDHIAIPTGCLIEQIANQSTPLYPGDKRYIIDQNLWDRLDSDDRAGLVLHEVIYREAIEIGHQNSVSTRLLNSNITSRRIESMSVEQFTRLLIDLGFTTTSAQGVLLSLFDPATGAATAPIFYSNGNLSSGAVVKGSEWRWGNQSFKLRDQVTFFESGQIRKVTLDQPASVPLFGARRSLAPFDLTFFESGDVESATFERPSRFLSASYDLNSEGAIRFQPGGRIALANILNGWINIQAQKAAVQGVVEFFPEGTLRSGTLKAPILLSPAHRSGAPLQWRDDIELNEKEEVLHGILAEDQDLTIGKKRVRFSRWYPLTFFPGNGELQRGCLAEDLTLERTDGTRVRVDARTVIELFSDGRLSSFYENC